MTTTTGLSAGALGGIKLKSVAGVGIGVDNQTKEQLLTKVRKRKDDKDLWKKAKAPVIDKIVMIDGELIDNHEHIAWEVNRGPQRRGKHWWKKTKQTR